MLVFPTFPDLNVLLHLYHNYYLNQQLESPPQAQAQLGRYRWCDKTSSEHPSTSVLQACLFVLTLTCCTPSVSAGRADYSCLCPAGFFRYLRARFYLPMCSCATFFCISSPATPADRSRFPFTATLLFHFSMPPRANDIRSEGHHAV